jgi:HAMP domain-containing protein
VNHLPYIIAAYALGVLVPAGYALAAVMRLGAAKRRLAALEPRGGREARR